MATQHPAGFNPDVHFSTVYDRPQSFVTFAVEK
jgi:hypothetical protein